MSKVRINDLARELEVKSRPILDALEAIGITGKTHSSSIEADQAEKVRSYFNGGNRTASASRQPAEVKPRFDLSKVSKPGDALKAILERKQAEAAAKAAPPRPKAVVAPPPSAPAAAAPPKAAAPVAVAASAPAASTPPAPRRIVPQPRQAANIVVPAPAPAIASKPPVGPVIARPPAAAPAGRASSCRRCSAGRRCSERRKTCRARASASRSGCRSCICSAAHRARVFERSGRVRGRDSSRAVAETPVEASGSGASRARRTSSAAHHHAADGTASHLHRSAGRSGNPGAQPTHL